VPEGDTILRTARTLARALEGRKVLAFRSIALRVAGRDLVGRRIDRIEARGKNLLVHFDDGRALYSHMRMAGAWHVYRPGEKWWKPAHLARAVIETDAFVAVCFQAPVVELLTAADLARHPFLSGLGPDILARDFDRAAARERLRALEDVPVGEAVLVQSAVAGIGNIYKSEALFAARIDPFAPIRELTDAALDILLETARKQMSGNLGPSVRRMRTTLAGERFRVYGRSGKPCSECGEKIRMRRQGSAGRSTYWCPGCQPVHIIRA
jgi:endonuclease-8